MTDFVSAMRYAICGVCGLALVQNLLAIVVFAATKKLHIKYYAFVANLAVADFLFALFTIPSLWRYELRALGGIASAAATVSLLTILAVAVNRYLALTLSPPSRYDSSVTTCRVLGFCALTWAFGLTYSLSVYMSNSTFHFVDSVVYPSVVVLVWVATAVVYLLAFRKIKRYCPPLASAAGISAEEEQDHTRVKQTRRLLVAFAVILVVSFVTWMPALSLRLMAFFNPALWVNEYFLRSVYAAYLLYALSSVINPLIYLFRLDGFKDGFLKLFCCAVTIQSSGMQAVPLCENTVVETGI